MSEVIFGWIVLWIYLISVGISFIILQLGYIFICHNFIISIKDRLLTHLFLLYAIIFPFFNIAYTIAMLPLIYRATVFAFSRNKTHLNLETGGMFIPAGGPLEIKKTEIKETKEVKQVEKIRDRFEVLDIR
jgi:hypothetical protein